MYKEVWWGNMLERVYLEDQGVNGRIILKRILKKWNGIDLAVGSAIWRALAHAERYHIKSDNFLTNRGIVSFFRWTRPYVL